jgi:4-hydroxy-tetrahydrodipicolinate reductase
MSAPLRIAVLGITGRMGKALIAAVDESPATVLGGALASPRSEWLGKSAAELGANSNVIVTADPAEAIADASVAIDFTLPQATPANLAACVAAKCPIVIGTTGLDDAVRQQLSAAARDIPVLSAPNMSLGVNLLLRLVELAASKLGDDFDAEIFEAHHRFKKDSPSGTALALGAALARGRGVDLKEIAEYDRHGVAEPRRRGAIGFSVFRGGDVVGDHTVTFAGIGERIELSHRASDRMAFARGAVSAARWIVGRGPGTYSMQDVLGFDER